MISEAVARDPLTVVSAPSGFGKTTSVAEWASGLEHVAWLGLNAFDSDPSRLTQGVVNALIRGAERSGRRLDLDRDLDDRTGRTRRSAEFWRMRTSACT